jgi:S-phase kinase-associated protein 1
MTQEWYRNFVRDTEREMLFELLTAANYMDIKALLDLACLRVTFELSQKTADEVSFFLSLGRMRGKTNKQYTTTYPI